MDLGMLSYTTSNVGDDMQAIGTLRATGLIPDVWVDRDVGEVAGPVLLLCNAWMTYREKPFSSNIIPIYHAISFQMNRNEEWYAHFKEHEPIGCRDIFTLRLMQQRGIDSYLSYCSTLTLKPYDGQRQGVLFVEVPDDEIALLPRSVQRAGQHRTHQVPFRYKCRPCAESTVSMRLGIAKRRLHDYAHAALVVTSKLHCALPCTALGTPVVLVCEDVEDPRFSGYERLLNIANRKMLRSIDWEHVRTPDRREVHQLACTHVAGYRRRIAEYEDRLKES